MQALCSPGIYSALYTETPKLAGRRVVVMGLGYFGGGVGVTRYLVRQGAKVTVTDLKSREELADSVGQLEGLDVTLRLGRHDERDFETADLVVFSPAIDPASAILQRAAQRGTPLETELNLFFKLCRAKTVIGITGSNGKTTTTALTHEILRRLLGEHCWLGGNIGVSLLEQVERIAPEDTVVLEISSFQLDALRALGRSPSIAVVTNLSPNHLDRHGTLEAYAEAKRGILAFQRERDWKILNADDPVVREFPGVARPLAFSLDEVQFEGAWAGRGMRRALLSHEGMTFEIDLEGRRLPGRFNVANMLAAACASYAACGWRPRAWMDAAGEVFRTFAGVEHRLEFVREVGGARFYNDSIATNPDSTVAALDALPGPFVLILGGYDKQLPFEGLARKIGERAVRKVVLLGQAAPKIRSALESLQRPPETETVRTLAEAVEACARSARPQDQVLLSPACASFDQFRNYVERGRLFKSLVEKLGS
jgi:UDP-N-acetylmuramoylalanine--D-glutamate ligase